MFGNGSDESSYHRKRIRKYSDKQSHNRIPDRFQIVHDYKIFHNVYSIKWDRVFSCITIIIAVRNINEISMKYTKYSFD